MGCGGRGGIVNYHVTPARPLPQPTPAVPVPKPLDLKDCDILVSIVDLNARVKLSQKFFNPNTSTTGDVIYTFTMLASATVYSFEMIRQDGTRVQGVVREKGRAKEEYDAAKKAGHATALGEEQAKDVFSVCIGNVKPSETVTINLGYMHPLIEDEDDKELRFTVPRAYMERYGAAPTSNITQGKKNDGVPFKMQIYIQQSSAVRKLWSRSGHNVSVQMGRSNWADTPPNVPDNCLASLTVSPAVAGGPSKDVVVVIGKDEFTKPRAFLEHHPSPDVGTTILGVTLLPRGFSVAYKEDVEYIVMVDCSGSMNGVKIKMTQEALKFLLRGLPSDRSYFNVFKYGSNSTSLWPESRKYDGRAVFEAKNYIDAMKADLGGTEVGKALDAVYASLPQKLVRPVSIFLLTDGGVWDAQACAEKMEKAIADRASDAAPLRVFTVGIGDGVSTETCERIARAGGGTTTYFIDDTESVENKCARLMRAARFRPVVDLNVTWGEAGGGGGGGKIPGGGHDKLDTTANCPPGGKRHNLFDPDKDYEKEELGPLARVEQAPKNAILLPSVHSHIYVVLPKSRSGNINSVSITGRFAGTNECIEATVEVQKAFSLSAPFLHTLAAKALIQDREDSGPGFKDLSEADKKTDCVYYGTTYGITSRYTSYLAIDNGKVVGMGGQTPGGILLPSGAPQSGGAGSGTGNASSFGAFSTTFMAMDHGAGNGSAAPQAAPTMGREEMLHLLSNTQGFDGAFEAQQAMMILSQDRTSGGQTAQQVLMKYQVSEAKAVATLVAWAYLNLCCDTAAGKMIADKADMWMKGNMPRVDLDGVQKELLKVLAF